MRSSHTSFGTVSRFFSCCLRVPHVRVAPVGKPWDSPFRTHLALLTGDAEWLASVSAGLRRMGDLTESFSAYRLGDQEAFDRIFAALYPDLTRLARARLRGGQRMTLVDTTMLVHECYLRFLHAGQIQVENRAHFFAYSARVMRSIIVDFARQRQAEQHGGGLAKVTLDTNLAENVSAAEDKVVEIAQAVDDLGRLDERLASVVEMRFFAGFTEAEIAAVLGVTERTVRRDFEKARLLLAAALS